MNDLKVALTLTADGKQLVATVNGTKVVVSNLNTTLEQTKGASHQASQGLNQLDRQSATTTAALARMRNMAVGAFAGLSAINLGQKLSQDLAAFQDVRTRLQSLSGTTAAYADNEKYLLQLTREHHKELIPLADNYAAMLNLVDSGLLTQSQSRAILEGMSNAQSALGATSVQLGQSMYGLSQALASPIVRAEELNQLVEPMPGLLNKMDRAAGLSAGGFRQMVLDGKVTSEFLRNNLIKALQDYSGAAAATAANISAQTRDMKNAYQQLLVAFESPINDSLTPVLSGLTDGLTWATDNADTLQQVFGVAMVVALTRASQAGLSYTGVVINKVRAEQQARLATIAAAQAELHKATVQRAAVLTSGQAVVADARLAAAREALAVATTQATIATRAFNAATALVGGPAGLALMAASGIAYLGYEAYSAEKPLAGLTSEVDRLNSKLSAMNEAQRGIEVSKLSTKMQEYRDEMADAQAEIDGLIAQGFTGSDAAVMLSVKRIEELQAYIARLEVKLNDASAAQQKLFKAGMPELTNSPIDTANPSTINKQQQSLLDNLTKQKTLYGDVSEAAKVRYEIEHGALKGLDPVINAKILQAAKELDAAKASADASKDAADAASAQAKELKALLAVLDPVGSAADEMAAKERLLKVYFEQANVPLERRKQLLAALSTEYTKPSEFDQLKGKLDPAFSEQQNHTENMGILTSELDKTPESEALKRNQINMLIEAEQRRHAEAMSTINGGISSQFDAMWSDTFDRFAAGIGSATADAIFESKDFGEAMQQITRGAVKSVIAGLVEIGVKKLALAALDQTIMASTAATATATAASTGASVTASMAPAAATSSIATFGGSAMAGIAAMIAAMAMLPMIIGKFHGGGTIPREGTYLLDGGETVYTRKQQQTLMNAMSASANGVGGRRHLNIEQHNTIVVSNESQAESLAEVLPQLVAMTKSAVVEDLNNRGEVWTASR
ncbi:tape measure protein [Shewanella insulae]|uniref:tape measure protein n=1 Tax=Shewanella insulae TaxID=2681496 RepID=UPI001EFC9903|nr:tape measure protein [Shewanella insulae]MCG9755038.1 tape measure protein [Shewanella insulae]